MKTDTSITGLRYASAVTIGLRQTRDFPTSWHHVWGQRLALLGKPAVYLLRKPKLKKQTGVANMDKKKWDKRIPCRDKLAKAARDRYSQKVSTIDHVAPYELNGNKWSSDRLLPCVWGHRVHVSNLETTNH